MANQTVTTAVNYDAASISGLLDGENITINGGTVTIDADMRWNQQAAVVGTVTLSSSLGGSLIITGTLGLSDTARVYNAGGVADAACMDCFGSARRAVILPALDGIEQTQQQQAATLREIAEGQREIKAAIVKVNGFTGGQN